MCDPLVSLVYGSVQNATFPIFSGIQDERKRLLNAYRKAIRFTAFLTFPLMAGAFVVADPLFHLLFKAAWWPAIPFFQLLSLGGSFTILTAINNNFIKVSGRSSGILKIEIIKIVLTIAAILLLFRQQVLFMVAGLVAVRVVVYLVNLAYTQRYTGYKMAHQVLDTLPYLGLSLVAGALVWPLSALIDTPVWLLLGRTLGGSTVYFGLAYLTGSRILKESINLLFHRQ